MTHVDIFKDMVVTSMEDNTYGSFKLKSYLDWGMSRMNYMEVRCLDDGKLNAHDVVSAMCQVRQDAAKYICRMIIGVHCGNLWITPRSAVELEKILPDQEDVIKKYKVKDKYKTRLNEIAKEIKKKYPQDFIDGGAAVAEDRSTGEVEEPPPRISYSVEDESSSSSSSSYENNNAGEVVDEEKNNAEGVFSHNDTETDNEESSSFVLENPPLVNNASIEDGASSSNVQIDLPEIEKIDKRMFFVNGMPPTRDEMMEKIIESYCNKKYTVFDIGNKVFVYDVVGFVALGYSMENEAQAIDKYDNLQKLHSEIFDGKILIVRKKADPRLSQNDNGCLVDCVKKEHVLSILSDLPKSYVGAAVKFAMDFEKQGTSSSGGVVVQPDNSSQIQLKSAPFDAAALIPRPDIIESFNALIEDGASSSSSVPIHPPAIDLIVDKRIFFVDGRPPTRDEMMDRIRRSYSKKYLEFDIDTGFFEYNVVGVVKLGYSLEKEDQARDVYDNQDQARVKYDNLRKLHPEIFDGKKIYTKQQFGLDSIDCVDLGSALDILLELPESGYGAAAKAAMEARLDFEKEGKSSSSGIISGDPGDAMPKLPLAIDAPMEDRSDFQTGASIITSSSDQPINTNDVVENQPDQQREAEVVEQIRKDVVVEAPQNQQQQGDGGIGGSVPVQMVEDPSTSQIQMNLETSATKRKKYDMSMFLVNGKPPTTGDILKITAEKNPGKLISLKSENGRDVYKVADLVAVSYKLVTKKEVKDKYDGLQKFHREIFVGKIIPTKRAGGGKPTPCVTTESAITILSDLPDSELAPIVKAAMARTTIDFESGRKETLEQVAINAADPSREGMRVDAELRDAQYIARAKGLDQIGDAACAADGGGAKNALNEGNDPNDMMEEDDEASSKEVAHEVSTEFFSTCHVDKLPTLRGDYEEHYRFCFKVQKAKGMFEMKRVNLESEHLDEKIKDQSMTEKKEQEMKRAKIDAESLINKKETDVKLEQIEEDSKTESLIKKKEKELKLAKIEEDSKAESKTKKMEEMAKQAKIDEETKTKNMEEMAKQAKINEETKTMKMGEKMKQADIKAKQTAIKANQAKARRELLQEKADIKKIQDEAKNEKKKRKATDAKKSPNQSEKKQKKSI